MDCILSHVDPLLFWELVTIFVAFVFSLSLIGVGISHADRHDLRPKSATVLGWHGHCVTWIFWGVTLMLLIKLLPWYFVVVVLLVGSLVVTLLDKHLYKVVFPKDLDTFHYFTHIMTFLFAGVPFASAWYFFILERIFSGLF